MLYEYFDMASMGSAKLHQSSVLQICLDQWSTVCQCLVRMVLSTSSSIPSQIFRRLYDLHVNYSTPHGTIGGVSCLSQLTPARHDEDLRRLFELGIIALPQGYSGSISFSHVLWRHKIQSGSIWLAHIGFSLTFLNINSINQRWWYQQIGKRKPNVFKFAAWAELCMHNL